MKSILIVILKLRVMGAFVVAQFSTNTTCTYIIGQEELPEQVKKLRRF